MAIKSFEKFFNIWNSKYTFKTRNGSKCHPNEKFYDFDLHTDDRISRDGGSNKIEDDFLKQDRPQLLARVTQKKLGMNKINTVKSPIPFTTNIYKASSDDFKAQKTVTKKNKKSVLTLPNVPAAIPQTCTVSDMNDSEYLNTNGDKKTLKAKKQRVAPNSVRHVRNYNHCPQISQDYKAMDAFTGDGNYISHKFKKNNKDREKNISVHDVWTILKNINRFQFQPSPPISDDTDSTKSPTLKKIRNKKRYTRTNKRVIETYRAKQFSYISSLEIDSNSSSPSLSQSSNFDRVTVIDKQKNFDEISNGFQSSFKTNRKLKNDYQTKDIKCNKMNNRNSVFQFLRNVKQNKTQIISIDDKAKNGKQEIVKLNTLLNVNTIGVSPNDNSDNLQIKNKVQKGHLKHLKNSCNKRIYERPLNRLHSGSSKVAVSYVLKNSKDNILHQDLQKEYTLTDGVTQLTHNDDNYCIKPKHLGIQDKRCIVTTLPSSAVIPKLTQTEIRRKLANLKFPIVILDRNQLGASAIEISYSEPPQFAGLDKHIWPFMTEWNSQTSTKIAGVEKGTTKQKMKRNSKKSINLQTENKQNIENTMFIPVEDSNRKDKQFKHLRTKSELKNSSNIVNRNAPIRFRSLNKKYVLNDKYNLKHSSDNKAKITQASNKYGADTNMLRFGKGEPIVPHTFSNTVVNFPKFRDQSTICKCPWAQSDPDPFHNVIDTILSKIKNGAFYNQERNNSYKDNSSQTIITGNHEIVKDVRIKETKEIERVKNILDVTQIVWNNNNTYLPGFDNNLTALEVKTHTRNELLVKDCTANVVVQFDVVVISDLAHRNTQFKATPLIPLIITESDTKVFKWKSSILNARLPAEICSLLPCMLKNIVNTNCVQNSHPYSGSNVFHNESLDNSQYALPPIRQPPEKMLSVTLQKLLEGAYLYNTMKSINNFTPTDTKSADIRNVKPTSLHCQFIIPMCGSPFGLVSPKSNTLIQTEQFSNNCTKTNNCTTLAIYEPFRVNTKFEDSQRSKPILPFVDILDQGPMFNKNINVVSCKLEAIHNEIKFLINFNIENDLPQSKVSLFSAKDSQMNCIFNATVYNRFDNSINIDKSPKRAIEYIPITRDDNLNKKCTRGHICAAKRVKKGFVGPSSRCKSTSSLERTRTPLRKINSLEDFVKALGCGKLLANIFDGHIEKKILSSLCEMRNWISEISQRQAMLVLLLATKKDTSNLIRFRTILLEGVAANRITRVSELDMEIEVIEREQFPNFSQHDGMAYAQDVDNHNNLMEEIYWIAKTTASDYQKPFNGSSEKLLRSLLEKRKKLNPSYLRVMARYVGLGLLKPPRKH